nr:MAG TPA: hypothetical protein [Caudoviricetes sp.]
MKRKLLIMREMDGIFGFEEIAEHNLSNHKGLPEIIKQAKRECTKMRRNEPNKQFAFMVLDTKGDTIHKEIYDE